MAGRSIEDTSIAFIGAGNLATNLAKALYWKGFRIVQVYSRTKESAQELAQTVEAVYTTELQAVTKEAQLYIVSPLLKYIKSSAASPSSGRLARAKLIFQFPDLLLPERVTPAQSHHQEPCLIL